MLIFRGSAHRKNANFWPKFSIKCLKMPFLAVFFKINCLRRRNFGQNQVFVVLWESSENQFGGLKKKLTTFSDFF